MSDEQSLRKISEGIGLAYGATHLIFSDKTEHIISEEDVDTIWVLLGEINTNDITFEDAMKQIGEEDD